MITSTIIRKLLIQKKQLTDKQTQSNTKQYN